MSSKKRTRNDDEEEQKQQINAESLLISKLKQQQQQEENDEMGEGDDEGYGGDVGTDEEEDGLDSDGEYVDVNEVRCLLFDFGVKRRNFFSIFCAKNTA